jgi:signal transduction histidine kinase
LPLSIGVAILRYRLWEIDPILNRVLVYSGLTLFVVGSYVLIVGGVGLLVGSQRGMPLLSILTTGLLALAFQPLRERLQRGINRLIYGERDEPYQVLARLGQRLETAIDPLSALSLTVETIAHSLKLPYVAIVFERAGEWILPVTFGSVNTPLARFPLIFAGETIGALHVGQRAMNDSLTGTDLKLLGVLARQISAVAHATLVSSELQSARLRIVEAREETRRRLGSDLHDGIGHQLTGLARKAELASQQAQGQNAASVLSEITRQLKATIVQVRALAHQLHPPELETLGLVEALREQSQMHPSLTIRIESPENLPVFPAAVETAAYYITLEALTNIEKHASAQSCLIRLSIDTPSLSRLCMLVLEISDDGVGVSNSAREGLGLLSMQGRAAEVGGTCQVISSAYGGTTITGGTKVRIYLPFQPVMQGVK